jgi:adenylate kinase
MLNIVLFGPPGAGKGTQSEKLISEFQLVHLSTGDILRAEIAAGTELGEEAKKLMDEGKLVPDEIVIKMISSKLDQNRNAKGFIFDGFPRTIHQAKALDRLLSDKNTGITKMISLKVTDEELTERLLLRGKETGRPDDQNEEIIRTRITEYFDKTAPLEDYYAAQDKFEAIDGIGSINEIFYAISNVIKEALDEREEELVESEGETQHKQADESFLSKATHIAKVVKDVVTSKLHDVMHPEGSNGTAKASADKLAKKALKKAVVKKAAKPEADKPAAKKSAPKKASSPKAPAVKSAKKVVKKAAPKKAAKKVVKKAAPKKATSVKKVVKKAIKKIAPKKANSSKASSAKAAKKAASKKVVKKVVKKAAKKVTKKVAAKKSTAKRVVKKVAKKVGKKANSAKASSAKSAKKAAPKKASKKAAKKSAPKKAAKKVVKKAKASKKAGRRR